MPMLTRHSLRQKLMATGLAAVAIVLLYQAHVLDSRRVAEPVGAAAAERLPSLTVGSKLNVVATAYCKGQTTASGVPVRAGIVAGDPRLVPEGSVIEVTGLPERYVGVYTVLDTGPKVRGPHIDVYMWSCIEAQAFGRRKASVKVVRLGWSPNTR
jgi:3D (Asp-Asp-Asp) domain-containing protein